MNERANVLLNEIEVKMNILLANSCFLFFLFSLPHRYLYINALSLLPVETVFRTSSSSQPPFLFINVYCVSFWLPGHRVKVLSWLTGHPSVLWRCTNKFVKHSPSCVCSCTVLSFNLTRQKASLKKILPLHQKTKWLFLHIVAVCS